MGTIAVAIAMLCANNGQINKTSCEKALAACVLDKGVAESSLLRCITEGKAD